MLLLRVSEPLGDLQAAGPLSCWFSGSRGPCASPGHWILVLWVSGHCGSPGYGVAGPLGCWFSGSLAAGLLGCSFSGSQRCWAAGFLGLWVPVGLQDVGSLGLWAPGGLQATGPGCTGLSSAKGLASWALGGPPGLWFWAQAYAAGALTESCKKTTSRLLKTKLLAALVSDKEDFHGDAFRDHRFRLCHRGERWGSGVSSRGGGIYSGAGV